MYYPSDFPRFDGVEVMVVEIAWESGGTLQLDGGSTNPGYFYRVDPDPALLIASKYPWSTESDLRKKHQKGDSFGKIMRSAMKNKPVKKVVSSMRVSL